MRATILLVVIPIAIASTQPTLNDQWTQFKTTHKKHYTSPDEEQKRFEIFSSNLAKIEAHNIRYKNGEVGHHKAMNKFGDLTGAEFLSFVNRNQTEKNYKKHIVTKSPKDDPEVDWRTQGVVSDVKDERECGASWSFSALGSVESQLAIKTGQLIPLSEQNLIDCSDSYGNNGCDGGFPNSAFDYIQENGIMSEADYPYEGSAGSCRFDPEKSVTKITGYNSIDSMSETSMANAVQTIGPVAASIDATEELQFYYGGVLFDDKCNINQSDLNHGVLVVGYGREYQYDYWIVKNSWGPDWGENGYYRSIRNYGNNCGIATAAVYPTL